MTLTERGYVIQWPDGKLEAYTFASNRHDCWKVLCGDSSDKFQKAKRDVCKRYDLRCVPAVRTIETEE